MTIGTSSLSQSKRWLEKLYSGSETGGVLVLDYKPCEMICDELAETINKKYPIAEWKLQ